MDIHFDKNTPWPNMSRQEAALSAKLTKRIRTDIGVVGGRIPFSRYMHMVLYEPGLGYYSAGAKKLGSAGDFVTAPEISPLFSQCLAHQCVEILERIDGGDIFELGAGTGRMAVDLLRELEKLGKLPTHYLILEVSADLRSRQQEMIRRQFPGMQSRVVWLDELPRHPIHGVVLANEVIDAFPVERFRIIDGEVQEIGVTIDGDDLVFDVAPAGHRLSAAVHRLEELRGSTFANGYESEICASMPAWMASVAKSLERGVILFIDYGHVRSDYYHPQRNRGTLLCHYKHRAHNDPLFRPGLQDLTAWVDFSELAEAGVESGLDFVGFTTQVNFLLGCGLEKLATDIAGDDLGERIELARQVKLLTLPGEMGERFKVLGMSRDFDYPVRGFGLRDLRHLL